MECQGYIQSCENWSRSIFRDCLHPILKISFIRSHWETVCRIVIILVDIPWGERWNFVQTPWGPKFWNAKTLNKMINYLKNILVLGVFEGPQKPQLAIFRGFGGPQTCPKTKKIFSYLSLSFPEPFYFLFCDNFKSFYDILKIILNFWWKIGILYSPNGKFLAKVFWTPLPPPQILCVLHILSFLYTGNQMLILGTECWYWGQGVWVNPWWGGQGEFGGDNPGGGDRGSLEETNPGGQR